MINKNHFSSRLEKKTQKKLLWQTGLWLTLTILLITGLVVYGLPLFIKMATLYGDWASGDAQVQSDDTVPPAPPQFNIPFEATKSATLNINGFAEPGSTINIYKNQTLEKTVITETSGQFFVSDISLTNGFNSVYATAIDQAQNKSNESKKYQITYDSQPPKLEIEQPQSDAQFYGTGQNRIEVKGISDESAFVTINNRSVIIDQQGKFSIFISLTEGAQIIEVTATDLAGNETKKEITVTYNK